MPVLRSRHSLSKTPPKNLIPSPEHFAPTIINSSTKTSVAVATAFSVTKSQRRLSLRLANKFSSLATVAADEGSNERKCTCNGSAVSCPSDSGEKLCLQLQSGSSMPRGRLRTVSDHIEQEEEMAVSCKEGGSGNGAEEKVNITRRPLGCKVVSPDTYDTATVRKHSYKVSSRMLRTVSNDAKEEVEMLTSFNEGCPGDGVEEQVELMIRKNEQGPIAMQSPSMNKCRRVEGVVQSADSHMEDGEKKREVYLSTQNESGYMSLRSGSRVPKRKIRDDGNDLLFVHENLDRFPGKGVKRMNVSYPRIEFFEKPIDTMFTNSGKIVTAHIDGGNFGKKNKMQDGSVVEEDQLGVAGANGLDDQGGEKLFLDDDELLESECGISGIRDVDFNVDLIPKAVHEEILIDDVIHPRMSKRYSWKEKGKEKLSSKDSEMIGEQSTKNEVEFSNVNGLREQNSGGSQGKGGSRREAARNTAIKLASQFAFFKAEEEAIEETEVIDSLLDEKEDEDWPGPVSTAMKIIEEREMILRARSLHLSSQNEKAEVKIPWTPSIGKPVSLGNLAPPLKDLCLKVLCDNAEEVESLEGLPDAIKHKIAMMLCHSRRMSFHVLGLLTKGSPMEIHLSDCSWATEKQVEEVFSQCNISNLKVLQLDFCGRCLPDYVVRSTLARATNCLPSLNRLSLKGAYCLSDSGLDAIVTSAPLLTSLNLIQCSLITSTGIISLAEKLGPVLQELYIDVCHNVDALLILPALKKLQHLEVLSVAHLESVTDNFLKSLIPISGPKMRRLIVAGCRKLTNTSLKTIGENCPHLSFLDIRCLNRLTDSAIEHLANGGCSFQTLKLCHGSFSDEALAAFLEASGTTLLELVLNNIEQAAGNTALAISRQCSSSLRSLDLSFCRKMSDEALGLIADSCSNLRILKLFGCTQVTKLFLEGHSNSRVKLIGLAGSILDDIEATDFS